MQKRDSLTVFLASFFLVNIRREHILTYLWRDRGWSTHLMQEAEPCCHRRRINTEGKANVVAAGWGRLSTWMPHWQFNSKDDLKKSFWRTSVPRLGVNLMISHFFKASVLPSSHYSIHPFLQIILVQNSYCSAAMNWFNSVPLNKLSSDSSNLAECIKYSLSSI